jgi:EmrB/QacA subfamily drug resistance transporter
MRKVFEYRIPTEARRRWWALLVLSLGSLMVALDATIVIVALPQIAHDLHFSQTSLVWIVNSYLLTFAGFLMLCGRLGDLWGQRRLFSFGIGLFTLASLACGLSKQAGLLIGARLVQGLGGAFVSAISLSLVLNLFTEPRERAKALGVFGFVSVAGGTIALLLGGTLTSSLGWHWIFLINVPLGTIVSLLSVALLSPDPPRRHSGRLDIAGATALTLSLSSALYAIVSSGDRSYVHTCLFFGFSASMLVTFLVVEARVQSPLIPLAFFRTRNVSTTLVMYVLLTAVLLAWDCVVTLYLQLILGYTPLQVGLSFLPTNQILAVFALGLGYRLVDIFGIKPLISAGLMLTAGGVAFFAAAPVEGSFAVNVFPGMLMLGIGVGVASTPLLLASTNEVDLRYTGLVSGILGTASNLGSALGLAILVSVGASRTRELLASGELKVVALNRGYHLVFICSALILAVAALVGMLFLRSTNEVSRLSGSTP